MDEDVPKVDAARTALVLMDFQPAVLVLGALTESDTASRAAVLRDLAKRDDLARSGSLVVVRQPPRDH